MALTRKDRENQFSFYQIRHQQLAWALYIVEGLAANIDRAIKRNTFHLNEKELNALKKIAAQEHKHIDMLRKLLGRKPRVESDG
jgi:hypothetical protein